MNACLRALQRRSVPVDDVEQETEDALRYLVPRLDEGVVQPEDEVGDVDPADPH